MTATWGDATAHLAAAGIPEDPGFYREFTDPDHKAVLTVPQRITHAWRTNDPDTFADTFTANGSVLLQDNQLTDREQIRAYMREAFAGSLAGAHVQGEPLDVKLLAPGVAVAVTEGGIVLEGHTTIQPQHRIRAVWVIVLGDNGTPQLLSHQSSPVGG